jgi:hypothetical protein
MSLRFIHSLRLSTLEQQIKYLRVRASRQIPGMAIASNVARPIVFDCRLSGPRPPPLPQDAGAALKPRQVRGFFCPKESGGAAKLLSRRLNFPTASPVPRPGLQTRDRMRLNIGRFAVRVIARSATGLVGRGHQ